MHHLLTPAPTTATRPASPLQLIADIAVRQGGHVATWQCRVAGMSGSWVTEQVESRGWVRRHRGVQRLPGVGICPTGEMWAAILAVSDLSGPQRFEALRREGLGLVDACVMAGSCCAAATAWSGAWLLGGDRPAPAVPQLLVDGHRQVRSRDIRCVRSRLDPQRVTMVQGVPCAPPERIVWDAAWIGRRAKGIESSLHDLAIVLDRTRQLSVDEILSMTDEPAMFDLPRQPPRPLRRTAELLRPGFSHSGVEAQARAIATAVAAEVGLQVQPRPYPIVAGGVTIAEADLAIPEIRWDAEIDGPHHRSLAMQRWHRVRDGRCDVIDWAVTRYPVWDDGLDPAWFEQRYRVDLHQRIRTHTAGQS